MKVSKECIDMIKKFEGVRLFPYKPLITEQYYTIGYGHYGPDVTQDMSITLEEAEELLKNDLIKFENAVTESKKAVNQNQFDALVSFAYNCGVGNLKKLVANREGLQIADAMLLYNKAGGRVLPGLTRRREMERSLFLRDDKIYNAAIEVLQGKYGNNEERVRRLTEAGYDYRTVQDCVNSILKDG